LTLYPWQRLLALYDNSMTGRPIWVQTAMNQRLLVEWFGPYGHYFQCWRCERCGALHCEKWTPALGQADGPREGRAKEEGE
jgi:hypothetical protein